MALFQSGPYQSRVISGVVRWVRHWLDQGAIAGRQVRTLASWTTQILLYPIYLGFQAGRGLRARLEFLLESGSGQFPASPVAASALEVVGLEVIDREAVGLEWGVTGSAAMVDLPVYRMLRVIQGLGLPLVLPPGLPPLRSLPVEIAEAIAPSTAAAMGRSQGAAIDPSLGAAATYQVRGIASRLETRSLVLVTPQNQILDILSQAQQTQLRQRLVVEVAAVQRSRRFRQEQVRAWLRAYGPICPQPGGQGWGQRLLGWMQRSPVAIAANLFHETHLLPGTPTAQWLLAMRGRPHGNQPRPWAHAVAAATPCPLAAALPPWQWWGRGGRPVDLPVHLILQAIQAWDLPSVFSLSAPLPLLGDAAGAMVSTDSGGDLAAPGDRSAPFQPFSAMTPVAGSAATVQGIASCLERRSLVLVTPDNQILDILSPAQQAHLRQQIVVMVATYGRALQLQQQTQSWLRAYQPLLAPSGGWIQQLQGWIQQTPLAIAADLWPKSPSSPPAGSSRPPSPPPWVPPTPLTVPPVPSPAQAGKKAQARPLPAAALGLSTIPYPPRSEGAGRSSAAPIPYPARPTSAASPTSTLSALASGYGSSAVPADWDHGDAHAPDWIDTQASGVHYLQTPWERWLRWLDRLFLWLETQLSRL